LDSFKTNQAHFIEFLFHLMEVAVSVDFAHKKILFFTSFAQRNFTLGKSCGMDFQNLLNGTLVTSD